MYKCWNSLFEMQSQTKQGMADIYRQISTTEHRGDACIADEGTDDPRV